MPSVETKSPMQINENNILNQYGGKTSILHLYIMAFLMSTTILCI